MYFASWGCCPCEGICVSIALLNAAIDLHFFNSFIEMQLVHIFRGSAGLDVEENVLVIDHGFETAYIDLLYCQKIWVDLVC